MSPSHYQAPCQQQDQDQNNPFADPDPLYPSSNPAAPPSNRTTPSRMSSPPSAGSAAKNFTFPGFTPPANNANSSTYTGNSAIDGGVASSNAPGVSSTRRDGNVQEYPSVYDPEGVYGKFGTQQQGRSNGEGGGRARKESLLGGKGPSMMERERWGGGLGDPEEVSADGSRKVTSPIEEHAHGEHGSRTLTGGHEGDTGSSGFNADVGRLGHGLKEGIDRLRSR